MKKERPSVRKWILAACCAVAAMYIGGVACFFFGNIGAGASLLILSTVLGLAFLWHEDRRRKRETAASDGAEGPDGADAGQPGGCPDTAPKDEKRR